MAPTGRPLLALVSGAPGAGKTALAGRLASALGVPHLNRDSIWGGLRLTMERGAAEHVGARGVVAEYGALEHLLAVGVSLVADGTLYRGEMEGHVRRLTELAEVVIVHCRTAEARDRYVARQRETGVPEAIAAEQLRRLDGVWARVVDPLEGICRVVEVDTTDGYHPELERVLLELRIQG